MEQIEIGNEVLELFYLHSHTDTARLRYGLISAFGVMYYLDGKYNVYDPLPSIVNYTYHRQLLLNHLKTIIANTKLYEGEPVYIPYLFGLESVKYTHETRPLCKVITANKFTKELLRELYDI